MEFISTLSFIVILSLQSVNIGARGEVMGELLGYGKK